MFSRGDVGMPFTCSVLDNASLRTICSQQKLSLWSLFEKVFIFGLAFRRVNSKRLRSEFL